MFLPTILIAMFLGGSPTEVKNPVPETKYTLEIKDVNTYDKALQYAKERKGIFFVEFGAQWCPHCKELRKTVSSDKVSSFLTKNNVVLLYYPDIDTVEGKNALASLQLANTSIPAYCYIKDGKILGGLSIGAINEDAFIKWSETVLKNQP